jgi:small nuclear ribonucleoprotein (snRNP)-like protein
MDKKRGLPPDKITDYLGEILTVDLKNHHKIVGNLSFYHLTEQMIHMTDWREYEGDELIREGKYMVINRTAWYQLYK